MKKYFILILLVITSLVFKKSAIAQSQVDINNTKICQFTVTYHMLGAPDVTTSIAANPTQSFYHSSLIIGATFYNNATGLPEFTIGNPMYGYSIMGSGVIQNCATFSTVVWASTGATSGLVAIINIL